jgi:pSer/pThr/pTyr-binding forkhead associated (FHA) protein
VTLDSSTVVSFATDYSAVLRPLQWLVIVLVFLFFLRVVRAVWVEVRPAGPRQTRRERRRAAKEEAQALLGAATGNRKQKKQLYLEVLEPAEQAGRTFNLQDELTVGRSPGCGVPTSYDAYSSTLHARLYRRGDQLLVEDLGSTNGTYVNSERITKSTKLARGDLLQIGATVFEVTR